MAVVLANDFDGFTVAVNDTTFVVPEDVNILDDASVAFYFGATTNNALIVRGTIATDNNDAINAEGADNLDILIAHTGIVMGDNDGIELGTNTTNSEVTNNGKIIGRDNEGVEFDGSNNTLNNFGEIVGQENGVETDGDNHRIFNHGEIVGRDDEAVNMNGNGNRLVNTGVLLSHTDAAVRLQGNDNIFFNSGQVIAHGQPGVELVGAAGDVGHLFNSGTISGGEFAIVGSEANEVVINEGTINGNVSLGGGNDVFNGTGGKVFGSVFGGAGDDRLVGGAGDDVLRGGSGNDSLFGGGGEDRLLGGTGNDVILGNDGDDVLGGGAGDDFMRGGAGHDDLRGGSGDDRLFGDRGEDVIIGGSGNDIILGNAGDDVLRGGAGDDFMRGGDGHDDLHGGSGDDRLFGDRGEDVLAGGAGRDVLLGGPDADRFVYNSVLNSPVGAANRDRIQEFSSAEGDLIDLAGIDADSTSPADDSFIFIGTSTFTGSAGQLRYVDAGAHLLVRGDVDGDSNADFEIVVANTAALSASDFVL